MKLPTRSLFAISTTLALLVGLAATRLIAGLGDNRITPHLVIDGVEFGSFDHAEGLPDNDLPFNGTVVLSRNFVTEPSLYLWARQAVSEHGNLKDIIVMYRNSEGKEMDRLVLKGSNPVSWTVEASDPSQGGYHERVELSVQEITAD